MSTAAPAFLRLLGVDAAADERRLRRAYAARLKTIDVEADPAAFQALREAFEAALAWRERQSTTGAPAAKRASAPSPSPSPSPSPLPLPLPASEPSTYAPPAATATEFDAFAASIAGFASEDDARTALSDVHARLMLAAGEDFEARIADLLADGWRPGHEHLFHAARKRYAWEMPRALRLFGSAGRLLESAIQQDALFASLPHRVRESRMRVAARLRETAKPPLGEALISELDILALMHQHPHWLAVMAPMDHAEHWLDARRWKDVTERKVTPPPPPDPPPKWYKSPAVKLVGLFYAVLAIMTTCAIVAQNYL